MIVSFRLRSASLRAYSPHALANAASPPFTSFFAWYLATVSTDSGLYVVMVTACCSLASLRSARSSYHCAANSAATSS